MVKEVDCVYKMYEFTEEEEITAFVFNDLQLKHLQTELAQAATKKALLAFDPDKPTEFAGENEFLRGQMATLSYIIEMHNNTLEKVATKAAQQAAANRAESPDRS